jgi:uncharacterized protein YxjI
VSKLSNGSIIFRVELEFSVWGSKLKMSCLCGQKLALRATLYEIKKVFGNAILHIKNKILNQIIENILFRVQFKIFKKFAFSNRRP